MSYEKTPEAIRKRNVRQDAWEREHTVKMTFKFNKQTDSDVLEQLAKQDSKLGYIKQLIREDIARNQ